MSEAISIDLAARPESARRAREAVEPLRELLGETRFMDLRILVSGLVVEVIRAVAQRGDETVNLRVESGEQVVRAAVRTGDEARFVLADPSFDGGPESSGILLRRLSDSRGVRRDEDGTTAWVEMSLEPSAPPQG